jgi:DNA polymerase V
MTRVSTPVPITPGTPEVSFPLYLSPVMAGFPSPADDYLDTRLDLNRHLVKHPTASFFVRVSGDSMIGAGIHPGDMVIVDRALDAAHDSVILAVLNGEFTIKRLCKSPDGAISLVAENPNYPTIHITPDVEFQVWGVVTYVLHALV